MDAPPPDSHSFVIRIWCEEEADETHQALWRGHITHALSGQQRYFEDLDTISEFIQSYLEAWNKGTSQDNATHHE